MPPVPERSDLGHAPGRVEPDEERSASDGTDAVPRTRWAEHGHHAKQIGREGQQKSAADGGPYLPKWPQCSSREPLFVHQESLSVFTAVR